MRYHVEEFIGYRIEGAGEYRATDFHVCDERGRTARIFPADGSRVKYRRYLAEREAARLSGESLPALASHGFQPTCPSCRRRCHPDAAYCVCGQNLYRREWNGFGAPKK